MSDNNPIVNVKQGQLRGKVEQTKSGFKFNTFLGIPYAKPPLGPLRFKAPEPADSWQGIRDATEEGDNCYNQDIFMQQLGGSEDCLFVNVYTPELPSASKKLRAVMVWIHGGGFMFGSSKRQQFGPEYIIEKDIVFVSFNYRLGILGFLCLGDESLNVPGNAGLKDQVLLLKWVKENINAFGGDPNNVTIFGQNAGAASVHLHMLSPVSKGLFHKAIMQSGTALCPWSYGQANGIKMCELLGKQFKSEADALSLLRNISMVDLIAAQNSYADLYKPGVLRLVSVVVEDSNNTESFLPHHPLKIIASGNFNKVPVLIGNNSEEGLLYQISETQLNIDVMLSNFEQFIPVTYGLDYESPLARELAQRIKKMYYGNQNPDKSNKDEFYKLLSHSAFLRGTHAMIEGTLKHSTEKIFLYRLSLECDLNQFSKFVKINGKGVSHFEDLFYLFHNALMSPKVTKGSIEDLAIQRMTKWWTNFAKCGDPNGNKCDPLLTPVWPEVDDQNMHCMDINTSLIIRNASDDKYMQFWHTIETAALKNAHW